jgi:hypothetical protein
MELILKSTIMKFMKVIGKNFNDDIASINTYTYENEMKKGDSKETFNDEVIFIILYCS